MRIVKRLGLALVAVCAFSALAVSSASAHARFLFHPPGALLLASAGGTQTFHTVLGNIECTRLKLLPPGDVAPALESLSVLAIVDYEKCTAFGIAAVVHPVHYIIFANGLVRLASNAVILASTGCIVTVPAAKNQSLWTLKFHNNPANGGILILGNVEGITSSGVGGPAKLCEYSEEHEGKYTGTFHVTLEGGVIIWHAS